MHVKRHCDVCARLRRTKLAEPKENS